MQVNVANVEEELDPTPEHPNGRGTPPSKSVQLTFLLGQQCTVKTLSLLDAVLPRLGLESLDFLRTGDCLVQTGLRN